ncbi:MAG TPA: GNAT family N-acetyltransferase [Actinomycetota bacterium]|nr:GNAT family N-acetyltransferase [Actinomycetota bacterium]
MTLPQLDDAGRLQLASLLEDLPQNTIPLHALRTGNGRFYADDAAAAVEPSLLPRELNGFGPPDRLWRLLRGIPKWDCVLVEREDARELGRVIEAETGVSVRYFDDVEYTLPGPPLVPHDDRVRVLGPDDLPLLESRFGLVGESADAARLLLDTGLVAGAFDESGQLVGQANNHARTDLHAEIGVGTDEAARGLGLATSAASLVASLVMRDGLVPVWSTGEHNAASRRVAEKLGFQEVWRRTFVIPDRPVAAGAVG